MKFIPVVGRLIALPFSYGWTFGIGEMAILYFETKGEATEDELKQRFNEAKDKAEKGYPGEHKPDEALKTIKSYLSDEEYSNIKERICKDA